MKNCAGCGKPSSTLHLDGEAWVCRHCFHAPAVPAGCNLFERGHENPMDPDGTTAHIRDIKARRWDPKENRVFYYAPPRGYSFPKG